MRSRGYLRVARENAIKRKKRIATQIYGPDYYPHDGQYSKGKIHCGCGLCKFGRKFGLPTFKQAKAEIEASEAMTDYQRSA